MSIRKISRVSLIKILTLTLIFALAFVGGCTSTSENEPAPPVLTTELNAAAVRHAQIAAGAVCQYGGITVETGIDKNGNGVLDDAEVDSTKTQNVCNGAPGQKGDAGSDGVGSAGSAGKNALVSVASSDACPKGGKTVSVGVDDNGNGVLDAGEATSFDVCNGDDGHDVATASITTLISAETLSTWIDSGLVNGIGADRAVILDIQSAATYSAGHIPGALQMDSADLYQTRREGPANDVSMVVDGAGMDALVQKFGIDGNTTIVITGGAGTPGAGTILQMTRAYFTFRYWGFPKEKLKFLDGVNFAWNAAYGTETGPQPAVTPSTYSVKKNAALRADLRASLSEMIAVAAYGPMSSAVVVDMRSSMTATDSAYLGAAGKTTGVFAPGGDYTVFDGRIKGAKALNYTDMFDSANNFRFKSAEALTTMFEAIGITKAIYAHVH